MSVQRSELPPEYVAMLETHDDEKARNYGRKPVLPADETPEVLVRAGEELSALLEHHVELGTEAASDVKRLIDPVLAAVARREVTEPMKDIGFVRRLTDTKFVEDVDLSRAYTYFRSLIRGSDKSDAQSMERFRDYMIRRRKVHAERHGLNLDLTDDEWWEL